MANNSDMVYYYRSSHNNLISEWEEVGLPYRDWIQAYFRQSVRDHPVNLIVEDEDGDDVALRCMADSNDKITGVSHGRRIEIVQCRRELVELTLTRYP